MIERAFQQHNKHGVQAHSNVTGTSQYFLHQDTSLHIVGYSRNYD